MAPTEASVPWPDRPTPHLPRAQRRLAWTLGAAIGAAIGTALIVVLTQL